MGNKESLMDVLNTLRTVETKAKDTDLGNRVRQIIDTIEDLLEDWK